MIYVINSFLYTNVIETDKDLPKLFLEFSIKYNINMNEEETLGEYMDRMENTLDKLNTEYGTNKGFFDCFLKIHDLKESKFQVISI